MRAWLRPSAWKMDPSLPRMVFDEGAYAGTGTDGAHDRRKLRVAYLATDGWFDPCPSGKRAVSEAATALQSAGHEVIQVNLPQRIDGWTAARLYIGVLVADGNMKSFADSLEGERMHEMYGPLKNIADLPNSLRPAVKAMLRLL